MKRKTVRKVSEFCLIIVLGTLVYHNMPLIEADRIRMEEVKNGKRSPGRP